MHRIARKYRVKFAEGVTYHHPEYTGNYSKAFEDKQRLQDIGIVYFQILDEIRKSARGDSGFVESLELQWDLCRRFCLRLWRESDHHRDLMKRLERQRDHLQSLQSELGRYAADAAQDFLFQVPPGRAKVAVDTPQFQDSLIACFRALDEIRAAARTDSTLAETLEKHWDLCLRLCLRLWRGSADYEVLREDLERQRGTMRSLQAELASAYGSASLGSALRVWWEGCRKPAS
jgi:hypothetical protein